MCFKKESVLWHGSREKQRELYSWLWNLFHRAWKRCRRHCCGCRAYDHRITWVGKDCEDHRVQPPTWPAESQHHPTSSVPRPHLSQIPVWAAASSSVIAERGMLLQGFGDLLSFCFHLLLLACRGIFVFAFPNLPGDSLFLLGGT